MYVCMYEIALPLLPRVYVYSDVDNRPSVHATSRLASSSEPFGTCDYELRYWILDEVLSTPFVESLSTFDDLIVVGAAAAATATARVGWNTIAPL
jgi:hypothetical protein